MRKIFYFSGVHGTGKSTIIHELKKLFIPSATILDFDQFHLYPSDYLQNQLYRITNYYQTIKNTDASLLLVDRSPFDALMYSEALHKFESETGFTKGNLESVYSVFRMIPSEFYTSTYIIFLNLSFEKTMENINKRGRESSDLMFNEHFVKTLHNCFVDFYSQIKKIINVSLFEDVGDSSYSSEQIVKELQHRCWLQPYEVVPSVRLKID